MSLFSFRALFNNKLYRTPGTPPLPFAATLDRYIKRRYAQDSDKQLGRKRIFILPTYFGFIFSLTVLIMLIGSINYNNNPAFIFTFLLMGVGIITPFHTYRNLAKLSFTPIKTVPAFAGHTVQYWIAIDNQGGAQRFAIEFSTADQKPNLVFAAANAITNVQISLPTRHRGKIPYCIVTVETRYPFGLFRAWSYIKVDASCYVYPMPIGKNSQLLPTSHALGETNTQQTGNDDFLGLRNYHAGDSTRHIHWKAFAKNNILLTKQYSLPESNEVWFDWHQLNNTDNEQRLSQLCRWVIDAHDSNISYGLILPGIQIEPGSNESHKTRCLEALAVFKG